MLRVLSANNGCLVISGKNSLYAVDDAEALEAEFGARNKSHPNFFTHTNNLLNLISSDPNLSLRSFSRFQRRGDLANLVHSDSDSIFYEWIAVICKSGPTVDLENFLISVHPSLISSDTSFTSISIK